MPDFESQYRLSPRDYLAGLDFYTWTRHFHLLHDLLAHEQGEVLEVGTGDGILRRNVAPFVRRYTVMDINAQLQPDVVADLLAPPASLAGSADAVVCTEVLEHLPYEQLPAALATLHGFLRPGGRLYLTLPHRKGHALWVTPRQREPIRPPAHLDRPPSLLGDRRRTRPARCRRAGAARHRAVHAGFARAALLRLLAPAAHRGMTTA
jgi:SAM-dependent methyltransferase